MGKTTLAINIAENAAIGARVPTAIFSMEMPSQQLAFRMISSLGRVDQTHPRTGKFPDEDWSRINTAVQLMSDAPMFIDDSASLSPTEIRARARRLKREHGLGLIVVDYLQLMQVHGSTENRATEISEICRSLKALAKELELPVIALSQLNRSVEQRTDKRPVMSDLRESGAIEQDADLIVFIYREEVYNQETPRKGVADISIAKQRNGPIGDFPLTFVGRFKRLALARINTAVQLMSDAPMFIDDSASLSPTEIRARARRLKREHGLGLIVVDYLQLMQVHGSTENRATEISEICRSLKALAKELELPVIALSQLNRSVEQRTDKRPVMSDLRESGAIEQDADLIVFIYREEVYNQETPRKGVADISIAKQRNGPIGDFPLTFVGRFTKFENWVPDAYADEAYP